MGLCLEEDEYGVFICDNRVISGEDLCKKHNEEQKSIIYEYYDYIINDILYIERKFMTEYIQDTYFQYIIDLINIEKEIDNRYSSKYISITKAIKLVEDIIKPNLDIVSFLGKVGYLDEKVRVYKFPIDNKNKYKHIYNKYIIYYKHVVNKNLKEREVEKYKAYICYKDNCIKSYTTISFIDLFKILNLVYNKDSIIKHIYNLTYHQFDITNLLN